MAKPLLDPKNDFVFKRVFADSPELLSQLISDIRYDHPPVTVVEVLNPEIKPEELGGKSIVLDILARDAEGRHYNIEIQVQRHPGWQSRSVFYLARTFASRAKSGDGFDTIKPAIGIHLLDFDLFRQSTQATWEFKLRDGRAPDICFDELQLSIIELRKADRLGQVQGPLAHWIKMLTHWRDQTVTETSYEPVLKALRKIQAISDDEKEVNLAMAREKAILDDINFRVAARREGFAEGKAEGKAEGYAEGRAEVLLDMLQQRFGPVDEPWRARIVSLSAEQSSRLIGRFLEVRSLEELFSP